MYSATLHHTCETRPPMSADPDDSFTLDMIAPAAPRVEMSEAGKSKAARKPANAFKARLLRLRGPEQEAARAEARARPHISARPKRAAAAARFRQARLRQARLRQARLRQARLRQVRLRQVRLGEHRLARERPAGKDLPGKDLPILDLPKLVSAEIDPAEISAEASSESPVRAPRRPMKSFGANRAASPRPFPSRPRPGTACPVGPPSSRS